MKTPNVRTDVHRGFENPGMAIAYLQVNKNIKDSDAKEFLRESDTGSGHKTAQEVLAEIRYSRVNFNEKELQAHQDCRGPARSR